MPVDTQAKRFSMLNFSDGAFLPIADGSIGVADRAFLLDLYIGIPLAGPSLAEAINLELDPRSFDLLLSPRSFDAPLEARSFDILLPRDRELP